MSVAVFPASSLTVATMVHSPPVMPFGVMFQVWFSWTKAVAVKTSGGSVSGGLVFVRVKVNSTICPLATLLVPETVGV